MALPRLLSDAIRLIQLAPPLWPFFVPQDIPLLVFDGETTWLTGAQPHEPGWHAELGGWRWPDRHPALTANTAVTLSDKIVAAGVVLPTLGDVDTTVLASLLVHEGFHVYQHTNPSPAWDANELDALTYPTMDETVLHARAEETFHLTAALAQPDWELSARRAMYWRRFRHARLRPEHRTFEARIETTEGLAEYVETRFLGTLPTLNAEQAASLIARQWAYHSGAALGHLLDRTGTGWPTSVLSGIPLGVLLARLVGATDELPAPNPALRDTAHSAVRLRLRQIKEIEQSFHDQAGERLILTSSQGLQVTGFDPMNVHLLDNDGILHRRFLQLRLPTGGLLRMTGGQALAYGPAPMQITHLDLRGLPAPVVENGHWSVQDDRWQITLPSARVHTTADGWTCVLD